MTLKPYLRRTAGWRPFNDGVILNPDTPTEPPPPTSGVTMPSGVWGAGFQNAGDIHPTNPDLWLTGGDVAGVHLSNDGGLSWSPNNTNLDSSDKLRTTGIKWSENPATPNTAWLFTAGWNGSVRNYFMKGEYSPSLGVIVQWEVIHQVNGGWASASNGTQTGDTKASPTSGHPRQSKNKMIALDETNGVAYLGSADGIWRVNIDGTGTPTRVWGAGQSITSISLDPQNKANAFVTVDLGSLTGVHKLTGIRTGSSPTSVDSHRPVNYQYAQSCKAIVRTGTTRLVVATARDVSASSPADSIVYWAGGANFTTGWTDITGNLNADETGSTNRWAGMDAVMLSNGNVRILAANSFDKGGANGKKVGWTDWNFSGTPTWEKPVTEFVDPQYRVSGPTGQTWWLSTNGGHSSLMLDKGGFDSVSPCISESNPNLWMVPGRSGVWRRDLGASDTRWFPAVKGLAVTTSWHVLISKANPNNVAFGDVDWTLLRSTDGMETQPMEPNRPKAGNGWILNQNEFVPGEAVIGIGNRDNNNSGGLYRASNMWGTVNGGWSDELKTGSGGPWTTDTNTPGVKGVAIGQNSGGSQVILAALMKNSPNGTTANTGLWRKVGAGAGGTWSRISLSGYANTFETTNKQLRIHFAWQPGGGSTVWMSDPMSGLWQSRDYGATWTLVWAQTWGSIYSAHIVGDPTRSGVYYAMTGGSQSWKISGGNGASPTRVDLCPPAATPAAVAVHPTTGNIYVAEQGNARLRKSVDGGSTWTDITTPSWEAMCATVKHMDIGSNGKLYVAMYAGYAITEVE